MQPGNSDALLAVLEHMTESVAVYDRHARIVYLNPRCEALFGVRLADVVGEVLWELFPDAVGNAFHTAFVRVAREGGSAEFEHYYPPFQRWFANRVERVGEHVHVIAREITDDLRRRLRLELLARISTELNDGDRALPEMLARLTAIVGEQLAADCELKLLSEDRGWLERAAHWSTQPGGLVELHAMQRQPSDEGVSGEALRSRQAILVASYDMEQRALRFSAQEARAAVHAYAPGSVLVVPLLAGEHVIGVLNLARKRDRAPLGEAERALVTDLAPTIGLYIAHARRQTEAALLRQRIELLGGSIPALVAFVNRELRYEYVNVAYEQWLNKPRESILGRHLSEVLPPDLYARAEPHARRALSGSPVRYRMRFTYAGIGEREVDAQYAPAMQADGTVVGFSVLVIDVTAEARLAAAERARVEEERRASERLARLLHAAGRFARAVDAQEIARILIDEGFEALGAAVAGMWLLSSDHSELTLTHERGFPLDYEGAFLRVPMNTDGPLRECVRSGQPNWFGSRTEYAARHPVYEATYRPLDARPIAFGVLPLAIEGKIVGCVMFGFHAERSLSAEERTLLEALTFHAGEALRRARLYSELRDVSETREAIIHASPAAIMLLDTDGLVLTWNRAAERMFGWTAEESVGKPLPVVPPGFEQEFRGNLRQVSAGMEVKRLETRRMRKNGEMFDVDVYAAPVHLSNGQRLSLGMVFDITERKRVERGRQLIAEAGALLARSLHWEETLRLVVDTPVHGFVDWCCVDVLEGERELVRIAVSDAPENQLMPRRIPHDPSLGGASLAIASGLPQQVNDLDDQRYQQLARGELHLAAMRALAARSFMSIPLKVGERSVGAISFASRSRNLDELDLAIGSELANLAATALDNARLYRDAESARREAEAASGAKDQFLAMLGHELRNPLAPITTALHLMRLRAPGQVERERAVIERQVAHLSRLVDDLLDVSRITRGKIELRRERVTVQGLVGKAIEMVTPLLEQRRHQLTTELEDELAVEGDPTRLAQIVANLLTNAAKYTEPGGQVSVRAGRRGEHIELRVRDNGSGIGPEMLPHIFDMFVQAPQPSARTDGGLGLGLSIVKSLVQLHGGSVSAHSEGHGKGTEILVVLPAAPALVLEAPLPPVATASPRTRPRRVLVVDDNRDAAELVAEVFREQGHSVQTAYDGPSALRVASELCPEVAILDIGLPVMDGYELAHRLREDGRFPGLLMIAVTGYGQSSDRKRALAAGFDAHVTKPVSADELLTLIEPADPEVNGSRQEAS